jgi:N-acetylmuramoyl-L-alanine amidase
MSSYPSQTLPLKLGRQAVIAAVVLVLGLGGTPHFALGKTTGTQRAKVDTLVIHAIGGPECSKDNKNVIFRPVKGDAKTWKRYFEEHAVLGIHWIVDREGVVVSSIPEDQIANHANAANRSSVGIELVNNGDGVEPYPEVQVKAAQELARKIIARWKIPVSNVFRHSDLDRGPPLPCGSPRKVDPGPKFPWDEFRSQLK